MCNVDRYENFIKLKHKKQQISGFVWNAKNDNGHNYIEQISSMLIFFMFL